MEGEEGKEAVFFVGECEVEWGEEDWDLKDIHP